MRRITITMNKSDNTNSKTKTARSSAASKKRKKAIKKGAKALFGRNLSLVVALLVLICLALSLVYAQSTEFRNFVDGLGIFPTTSQTTQRPSTKTDGNELEVHFINVGQGDSTLLFNSTGAVLIDCGESEHGEDVVAYLESCGIYELEYFIITHPDADHMGCAAYILRNIDVKTFVINGKPKSTAFFSKALDAIEEGDTVLDYAEAGDAFNVGALRLDVLSPTADEISDLSSNDSSLVIRAVYGTRSFLFTGDAEDDGEELLLEKCGAAELASDVFSAGHHGSRTSNSGELLELVRPEYVVISCGAGNSYGHPHGEALDVFESVGATILRTDERGTVIFVTDGTYLTLK